MKKSHSKYFKASLAAAASGLTMGSAHGVVITTAHDAVLNWDPNATPEVPFDITSDGTDDYKFLFPNNNAQKPQITTANFGGGGTNQILFPEVDADLAAGGMQQSKTLPVLNSGATIDGSLFGGHSFDEAFFYQNYDANFYGDWGGTPTGTPVGKEPPSPVVGPVEGYVGLAVDAGGGNLNYGYARFRVDVSNATSNPAAASLVLLDSAYETDVNTPITIAAPPAKMTLEVNTTTGEVVMQNPDSSDITFDYYRITSNDGSLRQGDGFWDSLDDQNIDAGGPAPDGDFNNDGTVNIADYATWRNSLGSSSGLPNDGALDGVVDGDYYLLWKDNFGATSGDSALGWVEQGGSNANILAETFLDAAGSTLGTGLSHNLGLAFAPGGSEDLSFQYAQDGSLKFGYVNYVTGASLQTAQVPEASSFALLVGAGLVLVGTFRKQRK